MWQRVGERRGQLIALAAIFLSLHLVTGLGPWGALIGFAAAAASALLLPLASNRTRARGSEDGRPASEPTVRLVAEALTEPCMVLDRRGVVLYCNAPARDQFPAVIVGNPLSLSLRSPALVAALEAARAEGMSQQFELHQTVPTETWHRVSVAPLGMSNDDRLFLLTLHSITDERRLNALRSDFIANASHELRTPLASLLGFIDTLLGPAASDAAAREKFLGIMRAQAQRMSKLVDDLLSLSRVEMHQHLRPTETLDLGLLLREVCEGLQTQAREAKVQLDIKLPSDAVTVPGDRSELYEVFENLIDNAIKYGADGGKIEVALSIEEGDAVVEVADFGAGIEAEHVPRLTERFYRVDAESSRKKRGTGLGLAIVKHIVNRHRGRLTIRSRPGEGTRAEVRLPGAGD